MKTFLTPIVVTQGRKEYIGWMTGTISGLAKMRERGQTKIFVHIQGEKDVRYVDISSVREMSSAEAVLFGLMK